jgi:predicted transposase/invertase (TIGR01784 family)
VSNFTPQETIKYDKDMMTERDRINSINYARQEGEQAGLQKGLRKGLKEGERKGREEERLSNAVNFLRAGVPAETIANATGLSLDTVRELAAKI